MSDFELALRDWMAGAVPAMVGWLIWGIVSVFAGFVFSCLISLRAPEPTAAGFFKWLGVVGGTLFVIGVVAFSLIRVIGFAWTTGTMG